jgi:hypothetical protein
VTIGRNAPCIEAGWRDSYHEFPKNRSEIFFARGQEFAVAALRAIQFGTPSTKMAAAQRFLIAPPASEASGGEGGA